jgi:uncharacterized protein (DUF2147 family)
MLRTGVSALFRLGFLALVLGFGLSTAATADQGQNAPTGRWITAQHNAVIQISPCGADMCGQIVGLVPADPAGAMPTNWQGRPQCGMTIITTAPTTDADGTPVWKGTVLDPRNGSVYQAKIKVDQSRHLELHGYIGLPIFGQTQTWTPYSGRTLSDCRLAAATVPAQPNG